MKHVSVALAVALLFTACGEESGPPSVQQARAALGFTNGPDVNNPRILIDRELVVAGFLIHDVEAELFSLQAAVSRQFGCATSQFYTPISIQSVIHDPADPTASLLQEIGGATDAFLAVFSGRFDTLPLPVGSAAFCTELMSRKIGEGLASFRFTDNDLYAWIHDRANSNAYGTMAHGQLTTPGGQVLEYSGLQRCVWDGVDIPGLRCVESIRLR